VAIAEAGSVIAPIATRHTPTVLMRLTLVFLLALSDRG
jgi:hypothetical protein